MLQISLNQTPSNLSMTLPPSITVAATIVDVSFFTDDGATVQVSLPRPRGLRELPRDELIAKACKLAMAAVESTAIALSASTLSELS